MSKRYKFNEYGVCINPDESAKIGSGMTYIIITTALVRGKWTFGVRYALVDRGGCWGNNLSNPNWYGTQEAAITAALKWIKDWLQRQIKVEANKNNSVCKNANKLLTEIEKILPKQRYVQLDLFEF